MEAKRHSWGRRLFASFISKILANLVSVKVWIFFSCVWALDEKLISGAEFVTMIVALIGAREVWKVASLRLNRQGAKDAKEEKIKS